MAFGRDGPPLAIKKHDPIFSFEAFGPPLAFEQDVAPLVITSFGSAMGEAIEFTAMLRAVFLPWVSFRTLFPLTAPQLSNRIGSTSNLAWLRVRVQGDAIKAYVFLWSPRVRVEGDFNN
jgi:hypothetical protein